MGWSSTRTRPYVQAGTGGSPTPQSKPVRCVSEPQGADANASLHWLLAHWQGRCLSGLHDPAERVINRMFIYGSLARSERVLIVETPTSTSRLVAARKRVRGFDGPLHGTARVERTTLNPRLQNQQHTTDPAPADSKSALAYPIAPRVLRDIDYHAAAESYTLRDGHPTDVFFPPDAARS